MKTCRVKIQMPDGSVGMHTGQYPSAWDAQDQAIESFPDAKSVSVTVVSHAPRTCLELGLCQAQFGRPSCADCEPQPAPFAPGVIDGPYRRQSPLRAYMGKARSVMTDVAAWLMGPHP